MRNKHAQLSELKTRLILAAVTIAVMIVLAGSKENIVRGAGTGPVPRVTAITKITHDGYRKASLLADDSQLYVTELPASARVIAKVSLAKSERSLVRSPFSSLQALDLSPDHSKLLVSSLSKNGNNEFWTIPVSKGTAERVGELVDATLPGRRTGSNWSSPRDRLSIWPMAPANKRGSYTARADRFLHPAFLPTVSGFASPSAKPELNTTSLWEVMQDGSNAHALLGEWPSRLTACCGSWTAEGKYYVFQASQPVANTSIVVTSLWALSESRIEGGPPPLTNGPMSFGNVSAGRDTTKIWAIGVQPDVEVVKYEPQKKKFVPLIKGLSATDVDYSRDGKWIAYVSIPEGVLWRARADGSQRMQLTSGAERTALPRWSPDGKQIAFVSMKPGESWKLWLVAADGGVPSPLWKRTAVRSMPTGPRTEAS